MPDKKISLPTGGSVSKRPGESSINRRTVVHIYIGVKTIFTLISIDMCKVACCRTIIQRAATCCIYRDTLALQKAAVVPVQMPATQKPVLRPWTFTHDGDPVYTDIRIEHQLAAPFPRDVSIFKE